MCRELPALPNSGRCGPAYLFAGLYAAEGGAIINSVVSFGSSRAKRRFARVVTVEKARQVACILSFMRASGLSFMRASGGRRRGPQSPACGSRASGGGRSGPRLLHVRCRTSRGSRRPRACADRRAQEKHRAAIACLCCRPVMRWPVAWFTGDQRPWCGRAGCGRSRRSSGTPCAGGSRWWTGSGTAAQRCPGCSGLG